jgi:hypothetical protein
MPDAARHAEGMRISCSGWIPRRADAKITTMPIAMLALSAAITRFGLIPPAPFAASTSARGFSQTASATPVEVVTVALSALGLACAAAAAWGAVMTVQLARHMHREADRRRIAEALMDMMDARDALAANPSQAAAQGLELRLHRTQQALRRAAFSGAGVLSDETFDTIIRLSETDPSRWYPVDDSQATGLLSEAALLALDLMHVWAIELPREEAPRPYWERWRLRRLQWKLQRRRWWRGLAVRLKDITSSIRK